MSKGREFRAFDYVNRPYDQVRDALLEDAESILREATKSAASRAHEVAAGLHVNVAGIEVGASIAIDVKHREEQEDGAGGRRTRLLLDWEAATLPRLFPEMKGVLDVYALTGRETQLDFSGTYTPPLGPMGGAIDALVGHRIADASIHRFVNDVARYLRETLPG